MKKTKSFDKIQQLLKNGKSANQIIESLSDQEVAGHYAFLLEHEANPYLIAEKTVTEDLLQVSDYYFMICKYGLDPNVLCQSFKYFHKPAKICELIERYLDEISPYSSDLKELLFFYAYGVRETFPLPGSSLPSSRCGHFSVMHKFSHLLKGKISVTLILHLALAVIPEEYCALAPARPRKKRGKYRLPRGYSRRMCNYLIDTSLSTSNHNISREP